MNTSEKIISLSKALQLRENLKSQGKTVIFTNGCFDIVHAGHILSIEKAKSFGDFLFLGLNSDSSVKRLKGETRPFNNQSDRAIVMAAIHAVDAVIIFDEDTPIKLIKALHPDVLVKGADYKNKTVVGAEYSGRIELIPLLAGRSTTNLANKLQNH